MKAHRNRGLFSNYYLDELLPKEDEFKVSISVVKGVYEKVKGIWDKSRFEAINEDQLRKHFLDKVMDCLGWVVDVNAPVPVGEWSKRPDYAFFQDSETLKSAHKGKKEDYFKKTICVAEAKRWGRPLDRKLKTEADPLEVQNPSLQISRYLWLTGVKWGILTDGKYWRLYERETSKRLDIFYEIDLEDLIESGSPEDFRYFYLLFRKDAFPEFIEKVYKGSVDYAEAVGEELKENIYQALKILSQGFLKTPGNNLSEANLKETHDNSLILLYRLLFILYAEYRSLLPIGVNRLYTESYSLDAFKKEISNRLDKNEPIAISTFSYCNKLKELFEIINFGNKELEVPPYNGGLFDSEKHTFLEKHRVGDFFVARAIDLLSRSRDKAYIDYGSLEIRHLGSIYEGLLEYKLRIAEENIIPLKDKGKEKFVSLEEAKKQKKIREDEIVRTGEMYLVTDKGERKATGSYYTPDYIVKYIVENTLGPLVEEKRKQVSENIKNLRERIKVSRGLNRELLEKELKKVEGTLIDEILSLKVLDPAMGSGHFLVEATDFLARELLKVLSGEPLDKHAKEMVISETLEPYGLKEPEEEDIRWARREVVERCIFGVDLNPMAVELAKLSLWLYTVAKNRPLNFLDHHLRCGNSLIGARIDDLAGLPKIKKKKKAPEGQPVQLGLFESVFKEKVNILLGAFAQIESLPSDTVEQIRQKEKLYQDFRKIVSRFQDVADVWTSNYFGNEIDFGKYQGLQDKLRSPDKEWESLGHEPWFKKAKWIANEKRFFHWELEFPEVFFEGHLRKENPGFDVVVGNPPYERTKYLIQDQNVYDQFFKTAFGAYDIYVLFMEKSLSLISSIGRFSFIVSNKFLISDYGDKLRNLLCEEYNVSQLIDLTECPSVFRDALISPVVIVASKIKSDFVYIAVFKKDLPEEISKLYDLFYQCTDSLETDLVDVERRLPKELRHPETGHFNIYLVGNKKRLERKIYSKSLLLKKLRSIRTGVMGFEYWSFEPYITEKESPSSDNLRLLTPSLIDRYEVLWGLQPIDIYKTSLFYPVLDIRNAPLNEMARKFFESSKVVVRGTARKLSAALDTAGYALLVAVHGIPYHSLRDGLFLVSLINSSLLNWLHIVSFYSARIPQGSLRYPVSFYESLPIRSISFVTPKDGRKKLFEEAKNYYKKYLESGNSDTIVYFIESRLTKEHKPEPGLVKKHNADPLNKDWQIPEGALWEQSDVVHDILAYLAEQMIEMNKEKQSEIKGFLGWLESQLKAQPDKDGNKGIEALTGKSHMKTYLGDYQKGEVHLSFENFWKVLEKNRNRIQANLKSRGLYETIKSEYEKSLSTLLPLKEKLRKTDWLIDQIVYKLYGLTEEEIKVVEGQQKKIK
ncbi:MAG: N-6 DNA methylase [Nitrospirota bacterium]